MFGGVEFLCYVCDLKKNLSEPQTIVNNLK